MVLSFYYIYVNTLQDTEYGEYLLHVDHGPKLPNSFYTSLNPLNSPTRCMLLFAQGHTAGPGTMVAVTESDFKTSDWFGAFMYSSLPTNSHK